METITDKEKAAGEAAKNLNYEKDLICYNLACQQKCFADILTNELLLRLVFIFFFFLENN
jgi:hypothetical protein